MVQITRLLFAASLVAVGFATALKRTAVQAEADITSLTAAVTTMRNNIEGFPASGLNGALAIHTASGGVANALVTCTTAVKGTGALAEGDAKTILTAVQALLLIVQDALKQLVEKKSNFASLPGVGSSVLIEIHGDLVIINTDTVALNAALGVAASATPEKAGFDAVTAASNAALNSALEAFP
ncbi:hydrophobic surface binding protein [Roridomyces roridus]|uniref:Hydrophobic surface binding protein n=1 Tax=Roridomyces roridus TaxID=1738132 RepID=A0AAD7F919_9AGAR|nr:hydrophobic surface binding protein [Roridomyces roridus]